LVISSIVTFATETSSIDNFFLGVTSNENGVLEEEKVNPKWFGSIFFSTLHFGLLDQKLQRTNQKLKMSPILRLNKLNNLPMRSKLYTLCRKQKKKKKNSFKEKEEIKKIQQTVFGTIRQQQVVADSLFRIMDEVHLGHEGGSVVESNFD